MRQRTRLITRVKAAALLSVVALGALIYVRYAQAVSQVGTLTNAQRIAGASMQLLLDARDVDEASRGYVITGREALLSRDADTRARIPAEVGRLREAVAARSTEQRQADAFLGQLDNVLSLSAQLVATRRADGFEAARRVMLATGHVETMDTLGTLGDALAEAARQRVASDLAAGQRARMIIGYLILASLLSAIAMIAYVGVHMRRELRRRTDAENALRHATAETEQRVVERTAELVAAHAEAKRANRIKDDLLATVSHELRTPLNAIVGWAQILKIDDGQNRARAVEAIERNAFSQTHLIEELLDMSRMSQGQFTLRLAPVDLRSMVEAALETIGPAAAAKGVAVHVHATDSVRVRGDEARLQQVAWNLLSNAVKFTPAGGRVVVEVSVLGTRGRLRVTDSGDGIEPALLAHVFEPFWRGESRPALGLGLGLAIVRQIVERHGGTVLATSEGRHRGSSFSVVLPLDSAEAFVAPGAAADGRVRLSLHVLVVEDDQDAALTLRALLEQRGCTVRVARSVQEGLELFGASAPDVLLCDIGLPDGDGYALLEEIRRRWPESPAPAIALSAFAREGDRTHAATAGFAAYVTKPYRVEQLVEQIRRFAQTG